MGWLLVGLCLLVAQGAGAATGVLENPRPGSVRSGVGLISGWVCEADRVTITIDGGERLPAASGTSREDTRKRCGDADNGFGLLFNFNLLAEGLHTIRALADGTEFARARFTVQTLGAEFLRGLDRQVTVPNFPSPNSRITLRWQPSKQDFGVAGAELADGSTTKCGCYYASNCRDTDRGAYCNQVGDCMGREGCRCVPKPDQRINGELICGGEPGDPQCSGFCTDERATGARWETATPAQVAGAIDRLLSAYITVGRQGGGRPPAAVLEQIDSQVPTPWREEIIGAVHNILFALLAGDLIKPSLLEPSWKAQLAQVPQLSESAVRLIDSVREGFVAGLRENDPQRVVDPIQRFWAEHNFSPLHRTLCYSHGHPGAPNTVTCQINQIRGLLAVLLKGRTAVDQAGRR